jgi:hypothetical protein
MKTSNSDNRNIEYISNSTELDKFDYSIHQNSKIQTIILSTNFFIFFGGFLLGKEQYSLFIYVFFLWILSILVINLVYIGIMYPIKREFECKRELLREEYQLVGVDVGLIQKRFEEKLYKKSLAYKILKFLGVEKYPDPINSK